MKVLVTGSAGHLGEALVRSFRSAGDSVLGFDIKKSEFTDCVGSISDKSLVRECVAECDVVLHTATLHKPHIATHTRQQFIDTNISGTLNLLRKPFRLAANPLYIPAQPARSGTRCILTKERLLYG